MQMPRLESVAWAGWGLLIWGAPWSHAAMSIGTTLVAISALMTWWRQPQWSWKSSSVLWYVLLMCWFGLSLGWTDNLEWGLHILGMQAPLALLLLAWHFVPPNAPYNARSMVMGSALLALVGALLWGGWRISQGDMVVGREWAPWMSHVRLNLMAALGLGWAWMDRRNSLAASLALAWGLFVVLSGSFTGLLLFPAAIFWGIVHASSGRVRTFSIMSASTGLVALVIGTALWLKPVPLPVPVDELPAFTSLGNAYIHDPENTMSEGNHRMYLFVCEQEWDDAWKEVSAMPLRQKNAQGFDVASRLLRYLTSKGWPKDGEHIRKLSQEDVAAIEQGATHFNRATGIRKRLRQFKFEWEMWQNHGGPSGSSVFQRWEHWKAGWAAWRRAPWIGHGVGDTGDIMDKVYVESKSPLSDEFRHRAHMQHLTWAISGGLVAIVLWVAFWCSWFRAIRKSLTPRALMWGGVVLLVSCVFEDTFETQAGIAVAWMCLCAGASNSDSSA